MQSFRWKCEESSARDFLRYEEMTSPINVFTIFQLVELCASVANDFRVKTKGGKRQHYKRLIQIKYFNIISIAECCCEFGCTSEGSVINQSWSTQFPPCFIFQGGSIWFMDNLLYLCDVWECQSYINGKVSASQFSFKCYFLRHRNPPPPPLTRYHCFFLYWL